MNEFEGSSAPSIVANDIVQKYFDGNITSSCTPYGLWSYLSSKLSLFQKEVHVDVFNMHKGNGNLAGTRYICNLPNAQQACEASQRELIFDNKSNPTDMNLLHADRIAVAAWENGLFRNASAVQMKRQQVNQVISDYVHEKLNLKFTDLPLECLGQTVLKQLLHHSIRHGTEMLKGDSTFDVEQLKEKFNSFVNLNKFCSINVTAIVNDPEWKFFFQNVTLE